MRGMTPAGVIVRMEVASTTRSPRSTPSDFASSAPSTIPYCPEASSSNEPAAIFCTISATFASSRGSIPVTRAPLLLRPAMSRP